MPWYDFVWNFEPGGNASHVAEHGITTDDVERIVCNPLGLGTSRTTGRPLATGLTFDGRLVVVVYEMLDSVTVFPITAFEVDP